MEPSYDVSRHSRLHVTNHSGCLEGRDHSESNVKLFLGLYRDGCMFVLCRANANLFQPLTCWRVLLLLSLWRGKILNSQSFGSLTFAHSMEGVSLLATCSSRSLTLTLWRDESPIYPLFRCQTIALSMVSSNCSLFRKSYTCSHNGRASILAAHSSGSLTHTQSSIE